MEILLVVVIAVVVIAAIAVPLYLRGRDAGGDLEPPPSSAGTAVMDRADTDVIDEAPTAAAPPAEAPPEPEVVVPPRFFDRLGRARSAFSGYLGSVLGRSSVDGETWDELEEALILADTGVGVATELLDATKERVKAEGIDDPDVLLAVLGDEMKSRLDADRSLRYDEGETNVWLFVGVNGVGKTTTIGKVGKREIAAGRNVLMAAGDTFRAAAGEQLETWAERTGAQLVRGDEGADPSSVIFDGVQAAAARGCDLVLADTAGRLHTKTNLMDELSKVRRVADREPGHVSEVLLVVDATTGQNGLTQASQFTEATQVTGVVLTKLDGSAKGGIVFAIETQLGIPVKLVGLGETADDLVPFDPDEFVDALLTAE
ncbi:MAG: signal recognition particle-docking protein FtsY [Actinomycetota bacterium]